MDRRGVVKKPWLGTLVRWIYIMLQYEKNRSIVYWLLYQVNGAGKYIREFSAIQCNKMHRGNRNPSFKSGEAGIVET